MSRDSSFYYSFRAATAEASDRCLDFAVRSMTPLTKWSPSTNGPAG